MASLFGRKFSMIFVAVLCMSCATASNNSSKYVGYFIDPKTKVVTSNRISISETGYGSYSYSDVKISGRKCPGKREDLLVCLWLGARFFVVPVDYKNKSSWELAGVEFFREGPFDIRHLGVSIDDVHFISYDASELHGLAAPQRHIRFAYSNKCGLIGILQFHSGGATEENGDSKLMAVSDAYWVTEIPAIYGHDECR